MGARIPKGVLLVGPPGTGKTLLAKAVAGEAGVQFLSISGSDFVELYVGVGAGRVRDLFEQAKKVAPAIIFIDEIDAVGRQRGSGLGGGHDEREQTLNQLLVEMDGFGSNEGVIVMAATNRADILDNALLRPGRFDRQVYVGLPDIRGREAILKIHARDKQLAEDVDLNSIAKGTPGFAGADLENLMNEAALLAVRRRHRFINMEDVDEAILKVQMGPEKKSRKMSEKARRLTAYHESGHAVAAHYLPHVDPVHYITIIPRGMAGGFTLMRPQEDLENFKSQSEMFENIVMALGGRMAEKLFLDDISTGASGDIHQATAIALTDECHYALAWLYWHTGEREKGRQHIEALPSIGNNMLQETLLPYYINIATEEGKVSQRAQIRDNYQNYIRAINKQIVYTAESMMWVSPVEEAEEYCRWGINIMDTFMENEKMKAHCQGYYRDTYKFLIAAYLRNNMPQKAAEEWKKLLTKIDEYVLLCREVNKRPLEEVVRIYGKKAARNMGVYTREWIDAKLQFILGQLKSWSSEAVFSEFEKQI